MTTYPLSERATIYAGEVQGTENDGVVGRGTLAECAEIIEGLSQQERSFTRIEMDDLDLCFGPQEIDELLHFLRNEPAGLSNKEITDIPDPDR